MKPHPLVLLILDGFGLRESNDSNAINLAKKPIWDELWNKYPHTSLQASGLSVGLPEGQMGNSEVGHLTMGAGRVIYQDLTRVSEAVKKGDFFQNAIIISALEKAKKTNRAVHVLGLLSPGGVHSHEDHIFALLQLAKELKLPHVWVHPFLDGRDTPPRSALSSIEKLESECRNSTIKIASLCGRYYAMDRDKRWDRSEQAYDLLTAGKAEFHAKSAVDALQQAYARNESDEFVKPTLIGHSDPIQDGDIVIFMNFRADRARQLSYALTDPNFTGFQRLKWPHLGEFVTLTEYAKNISASVAYPPISLENLLVTILEQHKLTQLRIAETEKYAHVTYFFNGGRDEPHQGEDRILIPSQKAATYDLCPEMSVKQITEQLVDAILKLKYDVIICNFANADMVGHTGNFDATRSSIEVMDACIGNTYSALKAVQGEMIITADHGNAEIMFDATTRQPHTAHTTENVPFLYVGKHAKIIKEQGSLSDIAPTMLYLLDIPKPNEMSGTSLVQLSD